MKKKIGLFRHMDLSIKWITAEHMGKDDDGWDIFKVSHSLAGFLGYKYLNVRSVDVEKKQLHLSDWIEQIETDNSQEDV